MIAYQKHAAKSLTVISKKLSGPRWPRRKAAIEKQIKDSMQYIPNLPSLRTEPPKAFKLREGQLEKLMLVLNQMAHPDQTQWHLKALDNLGDPGYWRKQLKLYSGGEFSLDNINYTAVRLSQYYRAIVATNNTVSKIAEMLEVVEKKLNKLKAYLSNKKKPFIFGEDPASDIKELLRLFAECMQEMQKSIDEGKEEGLKTTADSNARVDATMRRDYS